MITRIFKIDNTVETNTMATDLAQLFSTTQSSGRTLIQVNEFYYESDNPFATGKIPEIGSAEEELQALFFLGHTLDDGSYGQFTPEKFAEHFDTAFEDPGFFSKRFPGRSFKPHDKDKVKDIYIFGCELGLSNSGKNDSYAQHLADQLHERKFTQVRVHAVAYEKQEPDETMYTSVTWKP
ncbi:MAG TPA: hypothetical protein VLH77_04300, partial [Gammaproteobacteria bacterium]|nr:hypothetical protein [Gammaproteobacteria bacterium]